MSKSKARALSIRLRDAATPDPDDIVLLGEFLIAFNGAMAAVADGLRGIGLMPTTRLKTSGTIIDKLKRQPHLDLNTIRDLAGARVVQRMSLDEQDAVAGRMAALWPDTRIIDRRAQPSWGYRAIHLVPRVEGCQVEVQLRTLYQDTWAQVMESLGDLWGRDIRYGGQPDVPDAPSGDRPGAWSRAQIVEAWKNLSDPLHDLAIWENDLARLGTLTDPTRQEIEQMAELSRRIEEAPLRGLIRDLAEDFSQLRAGTVES